MTTLEHDLDTDTIQWDDLAPPCEAEKICGGKPAELICKHRHFDPGSCNAEGKTYLLCEPCYEYVKKSTTVCLECHEPASAYAVERLK